MFEAGYISADAAERASREPLQVVARALESEAPYFVDYLTEEIQERTKAAGAVDVYTTLDLHYQRLAQDAVRDGLIRVDGMLSKRRPRFPQAALIAVDPRTGEILAMVGGRSYNQSQFNRAVTSKRQPGSVFKPFVYLAAFERAQEDGRTDITPATLVVDEPTTFEFNNQSWAPGNYDNEYDGPITLRRALAHSRNVATVKVAESTGFDHVAAVWRRFAIGTPPKGVSFDRAGRVRSLPARYREGLHGVSEFRHHPAAPRPAPYRQRRQGSPDRPGPAEDRGR